MLKEEAEQQRNPNPPGHSTPDVARQFKPFGSLEAPTAAPRERTRKFAAVCVTQSFSLLSE
jgi:hypothetical protein